MESLLCKIAQQLDKKNVPYMLIGGQAVLVYGRPRLTDDIDITLGVDIDQLGDIQSISKSLKFAQLVRNVPKFVRDTNVYPVKDKVSGIRIDFIFSNSIYEKQAIKRAKKIKLNKYNIKFASVEDVVIHKIFSSRAIDLEDIKSILINHYRNLDHKYIKKWLIKFSGLEGYADLYKTYLKLVKQFKESS